MNIEYALLNVCLLWMLTVPHEFAHAWAAVKLGDETPRREGRVTLNPLAHVDWMGTVLLPAITSLVGGGFLGWGKSVNTNPYRLWRGNLGLSLVALAGPISNLMFAVVLAAAAAVLSSSGSRLGEFAAQGVRLSIYLALFNLMPVPPLDGSKLLLALRLPDRLYDELSRFGFLLLIVAITATGLGRWMSMTSWTAAQRLLGLFS